MSRYPSDCKVYVGDLGNNATKQELEDAFGHYGPLKNVWVARNPPGFAFVEFEDARDAEDAVKGLDGRTVCGRRARVEISNGKRSRGPPRRGGGGPAGGGRGDSAAARYHPDDKCYDCGERGHYARDCSRQRGSRGSRRRSRSRSRSRSRQRTKRSYSRSGSRSRSRSRNGRPRSLSKSRSTSKSRTPRRSRSATPR